MHKNKSQNSEIEICAKKDIISRGIQGLPMYQMWRINDDL